MIDASVQEHPVNEALFNLVNVWSLMLWPLMLADKKGAKVKNKFGIYLGTQVTGYVMLELPACHSCVCNDANLHQECHAY